MGACSLRDGGVQFRSRTLCGVKAAPRFARPKAEKHFRGKDAWRCLPCLPSTEALVYRNASQCLAQVNAALCMAYKATLYLPNKQKHVRLHFKSSTIKRPPQMSLQFMHMHISMQLLRLASRRTPSARRQRPPRLVRRRQQLRQPPVPVHLRAQVAPALELLPHGLPARQLAALGRVGALELLLALPAPGREERRAGLVAVLQLAGQVGPQLGAHEGLAVGVEARAPLCVELRHENVRVAGAPPPPPPPKGEAAERGDDDHDADDDADNGAGGEGGRAIGGDEGGPAGRWGDGGRKDFSKVLRWGGRKQGLVDGKRVPLVVGDDVGVLEKGAAEGKLCRIGSATDGEVARSAVDAGVFRGKLLIKSGVWEHDGGIGGGRPKIVAKRKLDASVLFEQVVMHRIVDEIQLERRIPRETELLFECSTRFFREPNMGDASVDEGEDGLGQQ